MNFKTEAINNVVSLILKKMRKKNGITEAELATLLNISQQQVSRYENGKTNITIERINQYLEAFNLDWLYFVSELIKVTNNKI